MAEDTDLDLALAIALAEASDGFSDDDFKTSSRQLELRQQNLFAQCSKLSLSKATRTSKNKRQKTQSAGVDSRKKSDAPKDRETAANKKQKQCAKDVKNRTDTLKLKADIAGVDRGTNSGPSVEGNRKQEKPILQSSAGKEQESLFDSFRFNAPRSTCQDSPQAVHQVVEESLIEKPHEVSESSPEVVEGDLLEKPQDVLEFASIQDNNSSSQKSEDEDLILTESIGSPETCQPFLHEVHVVNKDVSGLDDEEVRLPADNPDVGADAYDSEEVIGLDNESQFSALLRLCTEESPEKEHCPKPSLVLKNCTEPGTSDLDEGADDISFLMTQPCVPQPAMNGSCDKEKVAPLQDITNLSVGSEIVTSDFPTVVDNKHSSSSSAGKDFAAAHCTLNIGQQQVPKRSSMQRQEAWDFQDVERGKHITDTPESRQRTAETSESNHVAQVERIRNHQMQDTAGSTSRTDFLSATITCPICEEDLSEISLELREKHTDLCLNKMDEPQECPKDQTSKEARDEEELPMSRDPSISFGCEKVKQWLEGLNLSRYLDSFTQHEIDWDTLQWLTDEDLLVIGVTCLGPRRKILGALQDIKSGVAGRRTEPTEVPASRLDDDTSKILQACGKDSIPLITNFFPMAGTGSREKSVTNVVRQNMAASKQSRPSRRVASNRPRASTRTNMRGVPAWMCIPGTPFRVDAFQHLSGDCSHWFLTHFHTDHYQGLTRGFRYGRVFCSAITARLVNARIGVSWDRLMIVPLNEKFKICGVDVTFIDANHCPGSVMILFEPPNGEAVLHTGDFRFCSAMVDNAVLQSTPVHTLILDTTYCDPQYDFPKQESVIQFVIEAIQAEAFNPDTLFLIGTYTIGKERVFLEVGKVLQKKIYVGAAKMKLLECMDLSAEDSKWLTCNEQESFIHVVPLWSISSFKRMTSISRYYRGRYKLIVAFSPTGWSFGRGKKKTPGKRHQQGTMIRYEVPYSEHSSFCELKEFVKFIAPADIIPSVPGKSGTSADEMIASLWGEDS